MAEELVFRLSIDGAEQELRNIDDLRHAVAELERNLETADFGSEAFKRAERELKAARGELYKFDRQLEALEDPVKAAEQWVKFGEGIAGGFAAAQGAAAIFGLESENLEKRIVQAQGAVSVAMGARMLAESQLLTMMGKTRVGTLALTAAQQAQTFVTSASTVATKAFRAALVSTGIGAIAVALGVLVANWSSLVNWVKQSVARLLELSPVLSKAAEIMGRAVEAGQRFAKSLGLIKDRSDEAKKSQEELTEAQIAGRKAMEEDTKRNIERMRREAEEARKLAEAREKARQEALGEAMDVSREMDALFTQMLGRMEAGIGGFSSMPAEVQAVTDALITERLRLDEIDAQIFKHQSQRNREQDEQIELIKKKDLELRAARIQSTQVALDSATNVAGSLSMLSQAFSKEGKRNEKVQKVLAIAQIAIDTAKGISGAVAAGAGLPFPANLGAIATGVASVIAGIASAKAALSEAGGGGGSTPSVNLPTFAPPEVEQREGQAGTATGEFGTGSFGPARAYVIGSDVSSDMEARQRVEDLASLGG